MKPVSSASKPLHLPSICLAGALIIVCAAPASADKRHPAPIVYATGTSPYPAGTPQYIEPSRAPDAQTKKQARIEFRYPGTPAANYATTRLNETGQGSATSTAPAARQYASAEAPSLSQPRQYTAHPAAAGSFDARAAAARIEAQRTVAAIESDALPSVAPAPIAPTPFPTAPAPTPAPVARTLTPAASFAVAADPVPVFDETGVAIVYGEEFAGLPTANGELFDQDALTAAHPYLPLPSLIQVVNTTTGKEAVLRVNDRGPFEDGAALQVSRRAAAELGMGGAGKATLKIRYLGAAPAITAPVKQVPAPAPQMVAETTYPSAQLPPQADYVVPASFDPVPAQSQTQRQPQPTYSYAAPSPMPAGDYFVQIGSFTDIANAQTLSNQVQASLPVTIVPARVNGADFFRVRVGPLPSRNAAELARQDLSYVGISGGRIVTGE